MPEEEDGGEDGAGESVRFLSIYIERDDDDDDDGNVSSHHALENN